MIILSRILRNSGKQSIIGRRCYPDMRKSFALSIIAALVVILILSLSFAAYAKDVVLKAKVTSVVEFLDKNGNPCVRIIVNEQRTLNGVTYTTGVPVMAFREMTGQVKGIKVGDTLHVIAAKRTYQDRDSYTILKVIE
jgi:hypothetical protein